MGRKKNPSPNLMKIKPAKNYPQLASTYVDYILKGFDLTMEEIAEYLRCSYDFVQKKIAPHIKHIVVNTTARQALLKYERESDYVHLFYKRLLFERNNFHEYLLKNCTLVTEYEPYYLEDLSTISQLKLKELSKSLPLTMRDLYELLAKSTFKGNERDYVRDFSCFIESLEEIPDKLLSAKDLRFSFVSQAYKHVKDNGIRKTKLLSLVRYRQEDLRLKKVAMFSLPLKYDKTKVIAALEQQLQKIE